MGALSELVGDLLETDDRLGDQLREHGNIAGVVDEVMHHLRVAAVDVNHITHALECVEGNAERQHDAEEPGELCVRDPHRRHHRVVVLKSEIEVFEEPQNGEIANDR